MASTERIARNEQMNVPDEETPLLPGPVATWEADQDAAEESNHNATARDDDDDRPLPLGQIFLLCYARVVEPIAFFSIFPFVNKMIQDNANLPEEDIGFYSGLIESLFSLTQMFVMIFWGRMADRLGRKPVLVISLFFVAIATSLFGFAHSFWQMVLSRCVAGAFSGSVVTVRTMITELSTNKTQARAFSFFAFSQNLGIFLGPLVGGALADPATQYPRLFSHVKFFTAFPYALPTIATGVLGLTAAVTSFLFVKETKPASSPDTSKSVSQKPMSTLQLLRVPGVIMVLYLSSHLMLLGFAFTAIFPLLLFTSVKNGGFGFTPTQISLAMGLTGFAQAVWLLLIFPPLQRRIGTGGVLRLCSVAHPIFFLACPLLNLLLRSANGEKSLIILFRVLAPVLLVMGVGVSMAFTAVQLALNNVAPNMETLGTLNALCLTLMSGNRAFSPWASTSLFAVGARTQIFGGYLVWVVVFLLAVTYAIVVRWLPEKAAGDVVKKDKANGHAIEEGVQ